MTGGVPERVLRFMAEPGAESFEELSLAVFRHQYDNNPGYRRWCESVHSTPASVKSSREIPAVPVPVFKDMELCCGTPVAEFRTSGTSSQAPGRHLLPSLDHYRTGCLLQFARCVLPEGWRLRTLVLVPRAQAKPHSSLARMFEWVAEAYGEPGGGWFAGEAGLEPEKLAEALLSARSAGTPVLMLGTTASFLSFYSFCDREGIRLDLPAGSRLVDTGGRKGTGADPAEPLEAFQARFRRRTLETMGIPSERCINEYGMAEMCSQFYDSTLADKAGGLVRTHLGRLKLGSHWTRTWAIDPVTLEDLPEGETGMLRHLDLANVGSVAAVLTEDLGRMEGPDGFILEGRPRGAQVRGCGLSFGGPA